MFKNLKSYLSSLQHLSSLNPTSLYPGHGVVIPNGQEVLQTYLAHRRKREDQILSLLAQKPSSFARLPGAWDGHEEGKRIDGWTVEEIVLEMYADVGFVLQNAAAGGGTVFSFFLGWVSVYPFEKELMLGLSSRPSSRKTRR